jgi:hypothetical protein
VQLRVDIRDADPAYVDEKVGTELYVHLRAVPAIVDFRRAALARAAALHAAAEDDECRRGALALLVLQRAMLAVEDLAGLLYALEEPPSFQRLVSYNLDDLSALVARLFSDPTLTPALLGLATADAIAAEPGLNGDQREALRQLSAITLMRVDAQLATVRPFWDSLRDEAKKTMHGLAFVAGRYAVEPPGAGMISRALPSTPERPFAVPLTTRVDHLSRHVNTEVGTIALTPEDVARFVAAGEAALDTTEVLVGGRLHGLETNHAYTVPKTYLDQLAPPQRAVLTGLFGDNDD